LRPPSRAKGELNAVCEPLPSGNPGTAAGSYQANPEKVTSRCGSRTIASQLYRGLREETLFQTYRENRPAMRTGGE